MSHLFINQVGVMYCECFQKILTEVSDFTTTGTYLENETGNCSKIFWELQRHKSVSSLNGLNTSYLTTPINIKNKFNCNDKKIKLSCALNILNRHHQTLMILEDAIAKSKQQDLNIEIPFKIQHVLGKTNKISEYIKLMKEYIRVKQVPLRINGYNLPAFALENLQNENQNHKNSLLILQLFYSLKNFYSVSFDC